MIVTVTLNPSLDRTLEVESLDVGSVVRTSPPTLQAGGKGVNVTRALTANGVPSVAILPTGGAEGAELGRQLDEAGVATRLVPVSGRTRSNITIAESDGSVTKLNEPGEPLSALELSAISSAVATAVSTDDWVVISGSVPPEFTPEQMGALAGDVASLGANLAIDTSGDALVASLAARPRLIKPNRAELAEVTGRPLGSISEVIAAAKDVRDRGVELVLVSLGADGAVLVGSAGVLVGESRVPRPRSTVGAGDCFLAGFLSRFSVDEADVEGAMLEALAWGAAAASLPGTSVPGPDDIDHSHVQLVWQPDLDRPLVAS
ncbi:1-phosphofructokinase [Antiquaquibacter soli]|uniref:1-phosphofructokinase n=1 Tax=Antiquaquibacter soli TaxID=3064523 RepID=A0ABT9BLY3_9MICO|nr:1-phosphofructokinase [Protaetiibacter sp. WY-16]MDO7881984.1 1-phosphofructokinase [Protaetiibacter sp. WY-16]